MEYDLTLQASDNKNIKTDFLFHKREKGKIEYSAKNTDGSKT